MKIAVRGFATLRRYTAHLPPDGLMEVPEEATIEDVFNLLGVPAAKKIVLVNGRSKAPDARLEPGDQLVFFPPMAGG